MNEIPIKEKYRLWWEYLKRAENFNRIEAGVNDPITKTKTFNEIHSKRLHAYFFFRHLLWLHPSFDDWWDNEFEELKKRDEVGVKDVTDDIERLQDFALPSCLRGDIEKYIKESFGDGENAPTDESQVLEILLQPLYGDLVIRISGLSILKTADLEKKIKQIIKRKRSALSSVFRRSLGGKITEGMRYKEVKRYLEVYDRIAALKEKKVSWEEIAKVFYPNTARKLKDGNLSLKDHDRNLKKLEGHQRRLKMEYSKAKKIILNAEKGQFPGKY